MALREAEASLHLDQKSTRHLSKKYYTVYGHTAISLL